ncbi:MAG: membrane protein insertase YidC [Bacteroidales bacterium]|jgi:YidC/Oxa1 family membrane protein insertase|nr:membrane protein insertase YidC [Bacteroidales bacterium]
MNKQTLIGLGLIFVLFIGYSWFMSPSEEERIAHQRTQDSLRMVALLEAQSDSIAATIEAQIDAKETASNEQELFSVEDTAETYKKLTADHGRFVHAAMQSDAPPVVVENDLYRLHIARKGGKIEAVELKGIKTFDGLPVTLFKPTDGNSYFGIRFNSDYMFFNTNDFCFVPAEDYGEKPLVVSGNDSLEIAMRLYPDKSESEIDSASYIEFLYTIRGNDYRTGLKINFVNLLNYIDRNQTQTELTWQAQLLQQEQNRKNEMTSSTIYYSDINDVEHLKESPDENDSLSYTARLKWVSFKQLFFTSTIISDDYFSGGTMVVDAQHPSERSIKNMKMRLILPYSGDNTSIGMHFYFGPNKYNILKQYEINLEDQIQLGGSMISWINKYAVIPIFNFFENFQWNYGLIILMLTIIIKTVLFPLTMVNYKSSAKMRVIKPEVEEINKRYPKQEDAMKKQQAIMGLYRQVGIKPMAGCLPMLLQMPFLFAMFRFFPSSYELRQQPFLWAKDLSSYDSIASWDAQIPILSTFYGNHISLFTLLMTVATLAYTVLNNKMMATGGNAQQMKMMKWMMYLMPVIFLGVFNNYSAGLSYYYLLVNLITFAQMGVFRLTINEAKLHAQMQANKNKPVTKSKWQQRMENLAKQQQAAVQQQRSNTELPTVKRRSNTAIQKKKKK